MSVDNESCDLPNCNGVWFIICVGCGRIACEKHAINVVFIQGVCTECARKEPSLN